MAWSPSSAFIMCVAAGGIYAAADVGHTKGMNAAKIMAASVVVGFVATALDDITDGPAGTALAGLFLLSAVLNKGANAIVLTSNLVQHIGGNSSNSAGSKPASKA